MAAHEYGLDREVKKDLVHGDENCASIPPLIGSAIEYEFCHMRCVVYADVFVHGARESVSSGQRV